MNNLPKGVLTKLYLKYPKMFCDHEIELYQSPEGPLAGVVQSTSLHNEVGVASARGRRIRHGDETDERRAGRRVSNAGMIVLREICDHVPNPTRHIIVRWYSDPFAQGAYSFSAVGATQPDGR